MFAKISMPVKLCQIKSYLCHLQREQFSTVTEIAVAKEFNHALNGEYQYLVHIMAESES